MRSIFLPTMVSIMLSFAAPCLADEPADAVTISPEALAALRAQVQVLGSRVEQDLATHLERKFRRPATRRIDEELQPLDAALFGGSGPEKRAPAEGPAEADRSRMVCGFEDSMLSCRVVAPRVASVAVGRNP